MLIGLVGKPSVGKSTFFKAATLSEVEIASYPFTTIKPNHGVGYVKIDCIDKEFNTQCMPNHGFCINHKRFVPIDLMDVAGLVPGASEGKGLGNQFLDDLRQADAFIHIVDVSGTTDETGKQTENYDVTKDILFLEDELDKWFLNILSRVWRNLTRKTELEGGDLSKAIANQFSGLKVNEDQVKSILSKIQISLKASSWTEKELLKFANLLRKETKPMIIAANKIDSPKGKENYEKLKKTFPEKIIIPCSSDSELALREAAKFNLINYIPGEKTFEIKGQLNDKQLFALNKIKSEILDFYEYGTGVQEILNYAVFNLLKYIPIFPAGANKLSDSKGRILPDCFLLPPNSTALDFAYFLHTDFGNNFLRAIDARTKKILGRDYKLKFGDALEIVTSK
ncbi:redox-regulated ATPase YchF [Candidatus Woesearchaeota archaeon]|nr:redox-regulated ATPase YchF [Candidatus Woesearchaeota archaeon]